MATWKPDAPALLAMLACLLVACSEPPPPEVRVRAFLDEVERLAEAREYTELLDRIAGDYLDEYGNDKLKAAAILRGFYLRNRSVHLLVRVAEITTPTPDRATARLYVAIAHRPFTDASAAALPDADMHRIDLELAADGDSYEILQTKWQRANAANVLF